MSKNASSGSGVRQKPDNPQETLEVEKYYYAGFFAAEMTCSVIKAANYNPVGHYYFAIDITVSNADKALLQNINEVVMHRSGIISPIKGAFNLSARGKRRVGIVLDFLNRYPIIAGDLAKNRIELIRDALKYLDEHRGAGEHQRKIEVMDAIRAKLRQIKISASAFSSPQREYVDQDAVGHFLAGVLDGEGSFGFKKSRDRQQPYFAVAMKDRKVIELCKEFLRHGNVRRRKDGMYHYEINHSKVLQNIVPLFLTKYPLRHARQRERLTTLRRLLNDYTRNPSETEE